MKLLTSFLGKRHLYLLFGGVLTANLLASLSEGASFSWLFLAFGSLNSPESPFKLPPTIAFLTPLLPSLSSKELFSYFILFAVLSQVLRSLFSYGGKMGTSLIATHLQQDLQRLIYQQILKMNFSCVSRYKIGDLTEHTKAPPLLTQEIMDALNQATLSFCIILTSIALMMCLSVKLTLIALALFGTGALFQKVIIRRIAKTSEKFIHYNVDFSKQIVQTLHSLRVVHLFNRQKYFIQKAASSLDQISSSLRKLYSWRHLIGPFNEILGVCLVGGFLFVGQSILTEKASAIPTLLTFTAILHRLNARIQELLNSIAGIAHQWGRLLRLEEILSTHDKEFTRTSGLPLHGFYKNISFEGVSLRYPNVEECSLTNLSLEIPKGSITAFVGHSGAGKSSLMDLLLALYEPTQGIIRIDGVNLKDLSLSDWRDRLGVVSQESFIFHETIGENIRFGHLKATQKQIEEAAKLAGAHEFISKLPQGYDTLVGERGYRLSGGERQRISLARALIRDPEILILDEATSNLDSHSESLIQEALDQLRKDKTILIVAHRLSTVVDADQIYLLEQGTLLEHGSHEELLRKEGKYAFFWGLQTNAASVS